MPHTAALSAVAGDLIARVNRSAGNQLRAAAVGVAEHRRADERDVSSILSHMVLLAGGLLRQQKSARSQITVESDRLRKAFSTRLSIAGLPFLFSYRYSGPNLRTIQYRIELG